MDKIVDKLLEHGITGALLVVAGVVIYKLYNALETARKERTTEVEAIQKSRATEVEAIQKLRVEDAKAYQVQLVDLIKTCTAAITSSTAAQVAQKEGLSEIRDSFEKTVDELREQRRRGGLR